MNLKAAAEMVLWLSASALAYTYVGYPLLLALLNRVRSNPRGMGPYSGSVDIVVAARNEGPCRAKPAQAYLTGIAGSPPKA